MLGEYHGRGKGEINFGNNKENKVNYILNKSSWEHPHMMSGLRVGRMALCVEMGFTGTFRRNQDAKI